MAGTFGEQERVEPVALSWPDRIKPVPAVLFLSMW
jgi:hypothetical protein